MKLTTTKWLELAASKDKTRFNLCESYRDKTRLVATDGHRMHIINGLPEVPAHFPSGLDAKFPDYKMVIPKDAPIATIELTLPDLEALCGRLAVMAKLVEQETGKKLVGIDASIDTSKDGKHYFCLKYSGENIDCSVRAEVAISGDPSKIDFGVHAPYLLDALRMGGVTSEIVTVEFRSDLAPIVLKSGQLLAVVMPCKLK